jgi:hypothetical protein
MEWLAHSSPSRTLLNKKNLLQNEKIVIQGMLKTYSSGQIHVSDELLNYLKIWRSLNKITTVRNVSTTHCGNKARLKSANACCHPVQQRLPSHTAS